MLEPVTSAVTGQRSNQLSYAPARIETVGKPFVRVKPKSKNIRAADAKEVGVGNPAEETYCYPNAGFLKNSHFLSILEPRRKLRGLEQCWPLKNPMSICDLHD